MGGTKCVHESGSHCFPVDFRQVQIQCIFCLRHKFYYPWILALSNSKAKLQARVRQLTPLATSCSQRELSILACAIQQLAVERQRDAVKELFFIQVETKLLKAKFVSMNPGFLENHVQSKGDLRQCQNMAEILLFIGFFSTNSQDQNFDRSTYPKSDVKTSCCVIPGGKYIATGPGNFKEVTAKETGSSHVCSNNSLSLNLLSMTMIIIAAM